VVGGFASSVAGVTSPLDAEDVADGGGADEGGDEDEDEDDVRTASVAGTAALAAAALGAALGSFATFVVEMAVAAPAPRGSLSGGDERRQYANPSARMPTATNGKNQRLAAGSADARGGVLAEARGASLLADPRGGVVVAEARALAGALLAAVAGRPLLSSARRDAGACAVSTSMVGGGGAGRSRRAGGGNVRSVPPFGAGGGGGNAGCGGGSLGLLEGAGAFDATGAGGRMLAAAGSGGGMLTRTGGMRAVISSDAGTTSSAGRSSIVSASTAPDRTCASANACARRGSGGGSSPGTRDKRGAPGATDEGAGVTSSSEAAEGRDDRVARASTPVAYGVVAIGSDAISSCQLEKRRTIPSGSTTVHVPIAVRTSATPKAWPQLRHARRALSPSTSTSHGPAHSAHGDGAGTSARALSPFAPIAPCKVERTFLGSQKRRGGASCPASAALATAGCRPDCERAVG
jgi:hypothetical protein